MSEPNYFSYVKTPGGTKPVRDLYTREIAERNARKLLDLENLYEYLNTSNTWFGCKWPIGNSNPEGTPEGNLLRLAHMQEIFKIGGYMVKNDHTRKKLFSGDHRHYEDGSDVDFTGADGHYQWGWGKDLYYAAWTDESYDHEAFDDRPIPGVPCVRIPVGSRSCAGYAALDRTSTTLCSYINKTARFRGGNNSSWDGTYRSLIGKPVTNIGMPTLATYARKNGNLWFTTERVMIFITGALARVFFHNRHLQAAYNSQLTSEGLHQGGLGTGADYPSYWATDLGYNPYIDLDAGIEKGDFTGLFSVTIKNSSNQDVTINNIPSFMGLKNFYKYLWSMEEDALLISQADGTQAMYVENAIDGTAFDTSGAGTHILVGYTPAHSSASWSPIKKISFDYLSGMPLEDGGTYETFYADGYYNPKAAAGSVRGALVLGYAHNGGTAGSCMLVGDLAPSAAYAGGGAVLCEFVEAFNSQLSVLAAA